MVGPSEAKVSCKVSKTNLTAFFRSKGADPKESHQKTFNSVTVAVIDRNSGFNKLNAAQQGSEALVIYVASVPCRRNNLDNATAKSFDETLFKRSRAIKARVIVEGSRENPGTFVFNRNSEGEKIKTQCNKSEV